LFFCGGRGALKELKIGDTKVRKLLVWCSLALVSTPALAASSKITPGKPCRDEIQEFCPTLTDRHELADCLLKHEEDSSPLCRTYLTKLKAFLKPPAPAAVDEDLLGGRGGRGIPGMGSGKPSIFYAGWYTPSVTPAGLQYHQARASFPVSKSTRDTFSISLSGNTMIYDQPVTISSGVILPTQFYAGDLGAQFTHRWDGGQIFGIGAQAGKASDKPFQDTPVYGANIFLSLPDPPHSHWIFSLNYSNNSTFLNGLPIPGIAYAYATETFMGVFGFPFASMRWKPADPWVLSMGLFGNNISAEVAYGERKSLQVFAAFHSQRYSYMRYARTNPDFRVVMGDKRLSGGLRFPLFASLEGELEGGYAYGRSVYESDKSSFRTDPSIVPTAFSNTWFAGWNLRLAL